MKEIFFGSPNEEKKVKLIWTTDLHFDTAEVDRHIDFCNTVIRENPDAVLIGGDISNGVNSLLFLKSISNTVKKPFYFVLGNHDYYYGSIYTIRKMTKKLSEHETNICYLTEKGVIQLTPSTALIGHDGWADARAGHFLQSDVLLNDYFLIDELKNMHPTERERVLNKLGSEAADYLEKTLTTAFKSYQKVIVLTHVPPYRQACFYNGKECNDNWAPHFVCQAVGDALERVIKAHPEHQVLVLCGHSHEWADLEVFPRLRVIVAGSELGNPKIQGIIYVN